MKSDADNVDNMQPFYICTYTSWFATANHTHRIDFTFFLTALNCFQLIVSIVCFSIVLLVNFILICGRQCLKLNGDHVYALL